MRRFKAVTLAVTFLVVIVSGFTVLIAVSHYNSYNAKREKIVSSFANVQTGDTKQTVVQRLGQPDEVENCYDSRSNEEPTNKCVETYWYMSFLERWGFSFNKDGKVIDKTHNVSF